MCAKRVNPRFPFKVRIIDGKLPCLHCEKMLPELGFGLSKGSPTGRRPVCRRCARIQRARYSKEHRNGRTRDLFKDRARSNLRYAVKIGTIIKPDTCQNCGIKLPAVKIHGHHHDYSKQLDVAWLCQPCHALADLGLISGWSSPEARHAHNVEVAGSNPAPGTNFSAPQRRPFSGGNPGGN